MTIEKLEALSTDNLSKAEIDKRQFELGMLYDLEGR